MTAQPLALDVATARVAIDLIRRAGIDESDPDFAELVESECDVLERLRRMLRAARREEAETAALEGIIQDMIERHARKEAKAERIRDAVKWALGELGMRKLPAPDFTASITDSKPPIVGDLDPNKLPDRFVKTVRVLKKTAIREALEAGEQVEGVYLGNPAPILTIRTK